MLALVVFMLLVKVHNPIKPIAMQITQPEA